MCWTTRWLYSKSISIEVEEASNDSLDLSIIDEGKVSDIWGGDDNLFFFDELNNYQSCKSDIPSVDWSFKDSGTKEARF